MLDRSLIHNASPTLAGLKTGNLFNVVYTTKTEAYEQIRSLNNQLVPKGLRLIPLRFTDKRVLLYLYRPKHLQRDLSNAQAGCLLKQCGYCVGSEGKCVAHLQKRLKENGEFPHEIGLFLGYPPEDVSGFIENKACCAQCVGCWKVYGDVNLAKRKFAQYEKCTRIYTDLYEQGKRSLLQLTVAS